MSQHHGTHHHHHAIPQPPRHEYFLNAGEIAFSAKPCVIRTILGSCVGIALYDPMLKIGGMCHFLLSENPLDGHRSAKYGNVAIPTLIHKMLAAGSRLADIQAYIGGGALILDQQEIFFVGDRNIECADGILKEYKIRVARRDVGGERGRKMKLDLEAGTVEINFILTAEQVKAGVH